MAASPQWKVYRGAEYIASCKYPEDAAMLIHSDDMTLRYGHSITVWHEGRESQPAAESYDYVAETARKRLHAYSAKHYNAAYHTA